MGACAVPRGSVCTVGMGPPRPWRRCRHDPRWCRRWGRLPGHCSVLNASCPPGNHAQATASSVGSGLLCLSPGGLEGRSQGCLAFTEQGVLLGRAGALSPQGSTGPARTPTLLGWGFALGEWTRDTACSYPGKAHSAWNGPRSHLSEPLTTTASHTCPGVSKTGRSEGKRCWGRPASVRGLRQHGASRVCPRVRLSVLSIMRICVSVTCSHTHVQGVSASGICTRAGTCAHLASEQIQAGRRSGSQVPSVQALGSSSTSPLPGPRGSSEAFQAGPPWVGRWAGALATAASTAPRTPPCSCRGPRGP